MHEAITAPKPDATLLQPPTHHRGRVTTLLFQAGIDPEATDLLVMMEEN